MSDVVHLNAGNSSPQFFRITLLILKFNEVLDNFSRSYEDTKLLMIKQCLEVTDTIPKNEHIHVNCNFQVNYWNIWLISFHLETKKDKFNNKLLQSS